MIVLMQMEMFIMKSKFLMLSLNNKNEFRANMKIFIPSLTMQEFNGVDVKIDTGCPKSSIPIKRLGISKKDAEKLKKRDCLNELVTKNISFGVNDSEEKRKNDKEKFNRGEYELLASVTFTHTDAVLELEGVPLSNSVIKLSYDRTGNILIGMDILKDFDIHMGESKLLFEYVLLACPKNLLCNEYYEALYEHFGIMVGANHIDSPKHLEI